MRFKNEMTLHPQFMEVGKLDKIVQKNNISAFIKKLEMINIYDSWYFCYPENGYVRYDHPTRGAFITYFGSNILQWRELNELDAPIQFMVNFECVYLNTCKTGPDWAYKKQKTSS